MPDITVTVTNPVTKVVSVGSATAAELAALSTRISETGAYLESQIVVSSAGVSTINGASGQLIMTGAGNVTVTRSGQTFTFSGAGATGDYYPNNNPSGFLTSGQTGILVGKNQTGIYSGSFYPLSSNPSNYVQSSQTGILVGKNETGAFITTGQTGQFYATSNPNGYITASALTPYVQTGQTGAYTGSFYPLNLNPSGYLTGSTGGFVSTSQTGVLVGKNETGIFANSFYPLSSNPNGYLTGSTGGFVSVNQTGIYSGSFYPLSSNPSNYVTASQTGAFATTGYVTGASGVLNATINATGSYLFGLIQASSAGVSSLNGASGSLTLTGAGNVISSRAGQTITFSGDTGAYVNFALKSDTGGFLTTNTVGGVRTINVTGLLSSGAVTFTGAGDVTITQSGQLITFSGFSAYVLPSQTGILVGKNETGIYVNSFYPLNANPAGYLTGSTGGFVDRTQTGIYSGTFATTANTGLLLVGKDQTGIFVGINQTGIYANSFYPLNSNPAGYITSSQTGSVTLSGAGNVTVTSTGQVIVVSGDTSSLATISFVTGASGVLDSKIASTGSFLYSLIQASSAGVSSINSQSGSLSFTGKGNVVVSIAGQNFTFSGDTGAYANFVTNAQTGQFLTTATVGGVRTLNITGSQSSGNLTFTGAGDITLTQSGQVVTFSGNSNYVTPSQTGILVGKNETGILVGINQTGILVGKNETGIYANSFYPLNTNPSNYVTSGQTGTFITTGQTGAFYAASNPNGYLTRTNVGTVSTLNITGLQSSGDLIFTGAGNVSLTQSGQTITFSGATGVLVNRNETGIYSNSFYPLNSNPAGYLTGSTGGFVSVTQTGIYSGSFYPLNSNPAGYITGSTGGFLSASQTGILVGKNETGIYANSFYPLNSNPAGYLTGSTGGFVSVTQTGIYSGTFYPLNANPAGYLTGSTGGFLSASQTGILVGKNETGIYANSFYPLNTNPAGYVTGSTGGFVSVTQTGIYSGTFYPLNANPAAYLTGSTGGFVSITQTGIYSGSFYPLNTNPAGYLTGSTGGFLSASQTGVLVGKNETGIYANSFYPLNSNPSGYLTAGTIGGVNSLNVTGAVVSGAVILTGVGNITLTASGQTITVSGATGSLVAKSDTGVYTNTFVQLSQTGIYSGTFATIANTGLLLVGKDQTGQFVGTNQTGNFATVAVTGLQRAFVNLTGLSGIQVATGVSGLVTFDGGNLQLQINSINTNTGSFVTTAQTGNLLVGKDVTGQFAPAALTGNFLTSATVGGVRTLNVTGLSSSGNVTFTGAGGLTLTQSGQVVTFSGFTGYVTPSQTGILVGKNETGIYANSFYPLNSNPSNYVTTAQTGSFATTGYVTGVSGVLVGRIDATGAYLQGLIGGSVAGVSSVNSLTGAVAVSGAGSVSVSTNGQTIIVSGSAGGAGSVASGRLLQKNIYLESPTNSENLAWFNKEDIYVDSIVSVSRGTGIQIGWTISQATGRNLTGSLVATGLTDSLTTGNSLTTFSNSKISGNTFVIFKTQTTGGTIGDFSLDLFGQSVSNSTSYGVSSVNGASGALIVSGAGNVSVSTNGQTITVSGDTGTYANFALKTDTGSFVTTGQTGALLVGKNQTGIYSGSFYPLNSNPSAYLTGSTGGFVSITQTGLFAQAALTGVFVTGASNIGTGSGMFSALAANNLQFKSIQGGSGVYITGNTNSITINLTVGQTSGVTPTGDIPLGTAHTYFTVCSGNLTAGTYLVCPRILVYAPVGQTIKATAKLWNGGTVYGAASAAGTTIGANVSGFVDMSWSNIVVMPSGANPIALSVAASGQNSRVVSIPFDYATGINAGAATAIDILRLF
jgi:hypothetical protein